MPEPTTSRPAFRGHDETLPWSWVLGKFAETHNFWLATATPEHGPHTRPVWALWNEDGLLFTTGANSRKARDFKVEPRVAVHSELQREVVVVDGTVEAVSPTEADIDAYAAKYGWHPPGGQSWFVVRPRRVYAAIEETYPAQATNFDFS